MTDNRKGFIDGHITAIREIESISPEFLYIFLNSTAGQEQINSLYKGSSGQIELYADDVGEILVPSCPKLQPLITSLVQNAFSERERSKSLYAEAEHPLLSELGLLGWIPSTTNIDIKPSGDVRLFGRCDAEFFQPKYDEFEAKIRAYPGGCDTVENLIDVSSEQIRPVAGRSYNYCELADIDSSLGLINGFSELQGEELPSRARMRIGR